MVATAAGLALTERHRAGQAQLADQLVALLTLRYRAAARSEVDFARFVEAALAIIRTQRSFSATLARVYYTQLVRVETGAAPELDLPTPEFPEDAVRTSLYVTGSAALEELIRGGTELEEAVETAGRGLAGAGMRHTLNGARDILARAFEQDRRAVGYARVTREGCCFFCAMLASRGPVYRGDSFDASDPRFADGAVPSDHKVHDSCRCFLAPVYSRREPWPGRAAEFEKLWKDSTEPWGGHAKATAFRRAYEALQNGHPIEVALERALRGAPGYPVHSAA